MNIIEKKQEIKSFRVQLEKMDGGFVSDVIGKRAIFKYASDMTEHINIESVIDALDDNVYQLSIDIIPKEKMADYVDFVAQMTSDKPEEELMMSYQEAKDLGIIQSADKFDPNPKLDLNFVPEKTIPAIDASNCYTVSRLKSINWRHYHEQLPLTVTERCEKAGCARQVMYNQWKKVLDGKASFHLTSTRVAFTILAKYYESTLGLRSSSKDQMEKIKEDQLKELRELELVASHNKFVKSTLLLTAISKMRKQLL